MKKFLLTNDEGKVGIEKSIQHLKTGDAAILAMEAGIRLVEAASSARTVGFGGYPDALGEVTCDGGVMDGGSLQAASVGYVRNTLHVTSLAIQVMKKLPHVVLVGAGAERFARECGLSGCTMLYEESKKSYHRWLAKHGVTQEDLVDTERHLSSIIFPEDEINIAKGTVTSIAGDGANIATATSTSGWAYKYPGRLGDSPIVGGGFYADDRYGACVCTCTGETAIRVSAARSAVLYMKKGASVKDAVCEVIHDMNDLKGGCIGPVAVYAVDKNGEPFVGSFQKTTNNFYFFWNEDMEVAEKRFFDEV